MRIYITGLSSCGKSTISNKLSTYLKIPVYSTDNYFYKDYKKLKGNAYENAVEQFMTKNDWVIEGKVLSLKLLKSSDLVILLNVPIFLRITRQWSRFLSSKRQRKEYGFKRNIKLTYAHLKLQFFENLDSQKIDNPYYASNKKYELIVTELKSNNVNIMCVNNYFNDADKIVSEIMGKIYTL